MTVQRSSLKRANKRRKKKVPPAVTKRELEHLARMKRNLYRIEEESRELRRRLGIPDDPYEL